MSHEYIVLAGSDRRLMQVGWHPASAAAAIRKWSYGGTDSRLRDAADFGVSAAEKWRLARKFGAVATSGADFMAQIADDPKREVSGMFVATATWFSGILGCALFHRTWQNNVFLDFVAVNPLTKTGNPPISLVSYGLLLPLCELAESINAKLIWGETTDTSAGFYRELFEVREQDILLITRRKRRTFADRARARIVKQVLSDLT